MSFILTLVTISCILIIMASIDHIYNEGKIFLVANKEDLKQALIIFCIPLINIFVLILIAQRHLLENRK
jgi:hypothetical protein